MVNVKDLVCEGEVLRNPCLKLIDLETMKDFILEDIDIRGKKFVDESGTIYTVQDMKICGEKYEFSVLLGKTEGSNMSYDYVKPAMECLGHKIYNEKSTSLANITSSWLENIS